MESKGHETSKQNVNNGRDLVVDGICTRVLDAGSGDPLVLIHGLGGPLMWQRVIEPLAKQFRVISIHLPGFGDSDPPRRLFGPSEYATHILHTLDTLGIRQVHLAGISYGGQICATLAVDHPDRIRHLVLICSTGLMRRPVVIRNEFLWQIFSSAIKYSVLRSKWLMCRLGRRSFFSEVSRPSDLCDKFYEQLSGSGKRDAWLNAFRNSFSGGEEFLQSLAQIQIPALIVWGECDITVSPRFAERFSVSMHDAEVVRFKECAHSVPLEKPGELCAQLLEFLKQ